MAKWRSFSTLRPRAQVQAIEPAIAGQAGSRRKSRIAQASDEGVWTATLLLAFVALLAPVWFLGVGSALAASGEDGGAARVPQIVLIGLGCVGIWFAVRCSVILSRAPRLGRGHHRKTLPRIAIAMGLLAALFLQRFVANAAGLSGDVLAYVGAAAPALLLAEVSFALPAIARHRHGSEIGAAGGYGWLVVPVTVGVAAFVPSLWILPTILAACASICMGLSAVRVWRRYEGDVIST